jgi:hypothetical protein
MDQKLKKSSKIVEIKVFLSWDPDPLVQDPDPGGQKTYGSYGSGSTTLKTLKKIKAHEISTSRSRDEINI